MFSGVAETPCCCGCGRDASSSEDICEATGKQVLASCFPEERDETVCYRCLPQAESVKTLTKPAVPPSAEMGSRSRKVKPHSSQVCS